MNAHRVEMTSYAPNWWILTGKKRFVLDYQAAIKVEVAVEVTWLSRSRPLSHCFQNKEQRGVPHTRAIDLSRGVLGRKYRALRVTLSVHLPASSRALCSLKAKADAVSCRRDPNSVLLLFSLRAQCLLYISRDLGPMRPPNLYNIVANLYNITTKNR
jgi:hypothetical protein